jgi:beta-glucosidase
MRTCVAVGPFFSDIDLMSGDVSERALREIYLKPFQLALKHSNPWALMSA